MDLPVCFYISCDIMEQYIRRNQKLLRYGITTGTCAAAAAKAAATKLLFGIHQDEITVNTPKGISVAIPVRIVTETDCSAEYMVIKDSGDDPDVTNQAEIRVCVRRLAESEQRLRKENFITGDTVFSDQRYPGLMLDGGIGVGRVTKAGLEQKIGQAAINTVPRNMIFAAVGEVCNLAEYGGELLITVSVPKGEELAERTFNPRLGICGGISILGTSGILEPMSERAIIDTIETEIRQLHVQGEKNLLVTPGNYGQSYAADYLHLDMEKSVKCSNYIGDTLDLAVSYGMERFLLVGNIGKLVKLAAGIMNTHSKTADARSEIFAVHTVLCGGSRMMAETLMDCINTEEMLRHLEEWGLREHVMQSICSKIEEHINHRIGSGMKAGAILFSESFGYLGETREAGRILKALKK